MSDFIFTMKQNYYLKYCITPLGRLELKSTENTLLSVRFEGKGESSEIIPPILEESEKQLLEYFQGSRQIFNLRLAPEGTEFQQKVWEQVVAIPFGETASYLDIAFKTGSAKNTRAVGLANGKNPIPIIIPCHRIIGSNGKLTGYAGGLERKRWLLHHELTNSKKPGLLF